MSAGEKDGEHRDLAGAAVAIFAACLLLNFAAWRARTWELADDGLIVRWGLLNRRRLTIPYEHVHTVSVNSTLFERLFGLVTLDLDTGAAAAEGDASKVSGLRESEAEALRAELFRRRRATEALAGEKNGAPADPAEDRPLATFALTGRRLVLAAASRVSAVGQAFALVVLLVVLLFDALHAWGAARYGHTARELVLVSGGLTRRTAIVPRARLQRMRVSQSPFQRRAGVVTLSVRTAAGTEEGLGLRDVPADETDVLLAWFRPRARELSGPKVPN